MKVNDILTKTAELLNLDTEIVAENSTDEKARDLMIRALNNVISEIAEEYIPFIAENVVHPTDGFIPYSALEKKVMKVISIRDERDKKISFKEKMHGITLKCGDKPCTVIYSYHPEEVGYGDEFIVPNCVSERTISYGVAGEYALISERFEECLNYDVRFNTAIAGDARRGKERKLPYRRYL